MIKWQRQVVGHVLGRMAIIQGGEGSDTPGQKIEGVNVCLTKPQRLLFTLSQETKQTESSFQSTFLCPN